jgi:Na+/phosphate symporter
MEIISFAINLEHIGDIIDKNLCEIAAKRSSVSLNFRVKVRLSSTLSTSVSSKACVLRLGYSCLATSQKPASSWLKKNSFAKRRAGRSGKAL